MKNKGAEVSLVLVTVLSLLVIATIPAGAQLPRATVSIGNITLPQGATATIPIMIDEASNDVSSAQINLTYDPTVVQVTAVGGSSFDFFNHSIVNGKVRMIGFQWSPSLTAPTKFADVTVKAIGNPGDCTPLNLEGMVYMGTGSPYPEVEMNNGSVCIIAPVPVPAYNIFGMMALIGLLAIILAIKVRRR